MTTRIILLLIAISVIKGSLQTAIKYAQDDFPPLGLAGWRNVTAVAAMALAALAFRRMRNREMWWPAFGVGPLITVGAILSVTIGLFFVALEHTSASRATVLASSQPMMVLILARLFIPGERLTLPKVSGLLLGLGGVLLLLVGGHLTIEGERSLQGDVMILGSVFVWAVQSIYEKRILPHYRPFTLATWQLGVSGLLLLGGWAVLEKGQALIFNPASTALFLYFVFPVTVFVYLTYLSVLQYVQVSQISYFNFVMTVTGVFFGVALLGEPVTVYLVLSVLLVSGGVILIMRSESSSERQPVPPDLPTSAGSVTIPTGPPEGPPRKPA